MTDDENFQLSRFVTGSRPKICSKLTFRSIGNMTTLSLLPTARTSRIIVSMTGSSKVESGEKNSISCITASDLDVSGFAHGGPAV